MQDFKNISSLESLDFLARNLVEGFITGKHKSPYHGFSVEFAEHRLYNTGESTKHVDWKLYGRTDKLFVKKYEEETNLRCQIIIDTSSSMYYPKINQPSIDNPNKIFYSVIASAALMNLFKKQRDAVGLSLYSDKVEFYSESKTTNKHHIALQRELLDLVNNPSEFKTTSSVESIHQIASKLHKRSLVLFFTDMLEGVDDLSEIFSALQHLKFNKHEVILFHLSENKTEFELDFKNSPYKFIDIETKDEIKLNPEELKDEYKKRSNLFLKDLKTRCLQHKIDLVDIDISKGVEHILISYLLKRQKMF